MGSESSQERASEIVVVGAIALLTLLAWAYLLYLHRHMTAMMADGEAMRAMGMSMNQPWTAADAWFAFVMWTVMMAGMMSPSAAPVLLVVARSAVARGESLASSSTMAFAAGYFAVWTGFSALAAVAQWKLHELSLLSPSMATASPRAAGVILALAGLYQMTPEKRACLTHCRNPIDFLMTFWRPGAAGAFRMGVHHGLYCLGCCWALMTVLFAVGVMHLGWVAVISAIVLIEKTAWGGVALSRMTGVALILVGAYSAL